MASQLIEPQHTCQGEGILEYYYDGAQAVLSSTTWLWSYSASGYATLDYLEKLLYNHYKVINKAGGLVYNRTFAGQKYALL
jgi:hypothetical protein